MSSHAKVDKNLLAIVAFGFAVYNVNCNGYTLNVDRDHRPFTSRELGR